MVGGGDHLPGEVEVLQPVVVVQPVPITEQVALQVLLREKRADEAPEFLLSDEAMRAYIKKGVTFIGRAEYAFQVLEPLVLGFLDLLEVIIVGMLPEALEEGL